jgi:hypothetical protein
MFFFSIPGITYSSSNVTFSPHGSSVTSLTWKEACRLLSAADALVISSVGKRKIDCFGKAVKAQVFCLKTKKGTPFLRAIVDSRNKKINCFWGKGVKLSINCTGRFKKLCEFHKSKCHDLRPLYAKELDVYHSSITSYSQESSKRINCYFYSSKTIDEDVVSILK